MHRDKVMPIRFSSEELEAIGRAAGGEDRQVSDVVRLTTLRAIGFRPKNPKRKEVRPMESKRIGYVRLRLRQSGRWQADFRDPTTGRRVRQTIRATSVADATRQARALNEQVKTGRWQTPKRSSGPTVGEAMSAAIESSHANLQTRRDYVWNANRFLKWLGRHRPNVTRWSDLKTEVLRAYLAYCHKRRRLSLASLRYRFVPIKMASRIWAENDPDVYRDIARPIRFPKADGNPLEQAARERRKALSADDLHTLLAFLYERREDLYAVALLQAFCGLRILEALNLRECDVNFEAGTITVTETATHTPKTRFSYRTIPVVPWVLSVLRDRIARLPIGDAEQPVFLTRRGKPWRGFNGYCHGVKRALNECWQETGVETLRGYQPHWLRATFASACSAGGADTRVLQAYLGHCRGDILGLHYEQIAIERMRSEILPALEKWCHKSGTSQKSEEIEAGVSPEKSVACPGGVEPPTF